MQHCLGFVRYGDDFRLLRRYISQYFNSIKHKSLYPLLEDQIKILLRNLLDDPEEFESHLERQVSIFNLEPFDLILAKDKFRNYRQVYLWSRYFLEQRQLHQSCYKCHGNCTCSWPSRPKPCRSISHLWVDWRILQTWPCSLTDIRF